MRYLLVVILIFLGFQGWSQAVDTSYWDSAKIEVDTNIVLVDQWLTSHDQKLQKMDGYIILICSESGANSKTRAYTKQQQFNQEFPEVGSALVWKNPNYQVMAGGYRTKMEAEKMLKAIKVSYPAAIVRPAKIDFLKTP